MMNSWRLTWLQYGMLKECVLLDVYDAYSLANTINGRGIMFNEIIKLERIPVMQQ